jgi:hypothetical protein
LAEVFLEENKFAECERELAAIEETDRHRISLC